VSTTTGPIRESERLARQFFALFREGERSRTLDLVHPEVEWVLMTIRPGEILRGREEAEAFLDEIADEFVELVVEECRPLDDERVVVEGRRRTIDDHRVLRDDPMTLAMVFRDGLLWRSTPAESIAEAEAILTGGE
jgi:ketosteroid isomerase-like protein